MSRFFQGPYRLLHEARQQEIREFREFCRGQRARLKAKFEDSIQRIQEARCDEMDRHMIEHETTVEVRR